MDSITVNLDPNFFFQLATLGMILVLTLMKAINARGPVKVALSWILFLVNAFLLVGFLMLRMNSLDQPAPLVEEPTQSSSVEIVSSSSATISSSSLAVSSSSSEKKVDLEPIRKNLASVAQKGLSLSKEIKEFSIGDLQSMSNSEYEEVVSKANLLNNRTAGIQRKLERIPNKELMAAYYAQVKAAVRLLRSSGTSVRGFFNAENSSEEESLREKYQSNSQKAQQLCIQALKRN